MTRIYNKCEGRSDRVYDDKWKAIKKDVMDNNHISKARNLKGPVQGTKMDDVATVGKSDKSASSNCIREMRCDIEEKVTAQQEAEKAARDSSACRKAIALPSMKLKVRPQDGGRGEAFLMNGIPDTGCAKMSCGPEIPERYGYEVKRYETTPWRMLVADGEALDILGQMDVVVTANDVEVTTPMYVVNGLGMKIYLSFRDLIDFKAIPPTFPNRYDDPEIRELTLAPEPSEEKLKRRLERLNRRYKNTVFSGKIKSINGPPQKLVIDEEKMKKFPPRKCMNARQCPKHLQAGAADQIKKMLADKVIKKLPNDAVTPVVCPVGFTPKKTPGKVRVYTDFSIVNSYIIRSPHPIPKLKDLMHSIPKEAKYFATFDLADGYFQVDLAEESQKYTACICPQLGDMPAFKFVYLKSAQGMSSSADGFCERTDKALAHCEGLLKYVDDCALFASTEEELFERIEAFYKACEDANIGLNEGKCVVGYEIDFAGMRISQKGTKPDPKRLSAIRDAKPPTDLTSLRSFIGLCNTLLIYRSDISQLLKPLHQLTKKGLKWHWGPDAQHAFEQCKHAICNGPELLLEPFDASYNYEIHTDASLKGVGFNLVGRDGAGKGHLIQAGSRVLTDCETRYEMVSLELLAVVYAVKKCKYILLGSPKVITVMTDCKALIGLMKKELSQIENNRLLRLRQALLSYRLEFKHVMGKNNCVADYLSRYAIGKPDEEDRRFSEELTLSVMNQHLVHRIANDANMEVFVGSSERR